MREPNVEDAKLLLQLETLRYSPEIDRSFTWAWKHFKSGVSANAEIVEKAEAEAAIGTFSTFFETAGVLVRDGLLHEEIFYDRYAVTPFWKLARDANEKVRKATGNSSMGENFEWLATHEAAAQARVEERHRKASRGAS